MIKTSNSKPTALLSALSAILFLCFASGCEIEADESNVGSIAVSLENESGELVSGADIWLDGAQTSYRTPATITQVPVGSHGVTLKKPGYLDVSAQVHVLFGQTATVHAIAEYAPFGAIELVNAPDGTELIVNHSLYAVTPPTVISDFGIGTWNISAYLEGHATSYLRADGDSALSRLAITLAEGDTARINAQFVPLTAGPVPGMLAPVFDLPSDIDSSVHYRLQDYRGTITLVSFFFYNCAPCYGEFPYIQSVFADPANAGVFQVLGVDANDPWFFFSTYREDHSELGLTFPLLFDQTQHTRIQLYQFSSCPSNFLIDPTGMIRFAWGTLTEEQLRGAVEALKTEFNLNGQP